MVMSVTWPLDPTVAVPAASDPAGNSAAAPDPPPPPLITIVGAVIHPYPIPLT